MNEGGGLECRIETWLRIFATHYHPGQILDAMARDAVVPNAVTSVQAALDPKARNPQTGLQEMELAMPGLRKTVPAK
jgi:hypothetical protein